MAGKARIVGPKKERGGKKRYEGREENDACATRTSGGSRIGYTSSFRLKGSHHSRQTSRKQADTLRWESLERDASIPLQALCSESCVRELSSRFPRS
jgi:hypothetical protein